MNAFAVRCAQPARRSPRSRPERRRLHGPSATGRGRGLLAALAEWRGTRVGQLLLTRLIAVAATLAILLAVNGFPLPGHGGHDFAFASVPAGDEDQAGVVPMPFEKGGESFPGSAFYYLAADSGPETESFAESFNAANPLAPEAHGDNAPASVTPGPAAHALAQVGSQLDRSRALSCLTAAIYYEAASEPDAGQRAVAQVVLNRLAHPSFPKTVCGVVYQGSERATGCQFTFTCDGALARRPEPMFWSRAEAVARAALAGHVYAPVGLATHYHSFAVHPAWADGLNFIGQIGAHRFYRFEGPAGAAGAFRLAYAGGEPLPAPHVHGSQPARDIDAADPLALERAYEAGLKSAQAGQPSASNLPESHDIRPEYQGSGSWIGTPE